jgi:hypothetical protein
MTASRSSPAGPATPAAPASKVFGIGFQKTGTTTLGAMLGRLGYDVAGYHQFRDMAGRADLGWEEVRARGLDLARTHDAAKDTPWPLLYADLDRAFPGARFVHVVREPEAWIRSVVADFKRSDNALHRLIYGVPYPEGHEEVWLERYARHNAEVEAHFAGRPQDYLRLRLEDGLSFSAICPFLGHPVLEDAAPVANTRLKKRAKSLWWRVKRKLQG